MKKEEVLPPIPMLKKGGIYIKKKNRGKFTEYCGGKVTEECIRKGKNSPNPTIRKRATFAQNVRTWKHENGGVIKCQTPSGPLSSIYGGEIEAAIITPRQSRINKRRMIKELFTKIKSTLESNGDIIQLYNDLPEDQRKRALETIMKFSSAADPKIVKDWFVEEAKKHPLKAIKTLNYVITGKGQPVLFEPNRKYAYNGLFGGDYYFDKQTPINDGIIDAMLYNREINPKIGIQSDKQDYGPEIDYINRVYPHKNVQYIETRPGINVKQEDIQPTIHYGAQGSFKTSLPKRVINNQGIIIQEGIRNDSTFVRGLDVYDFKPDEYVDKWVNDPSMLPVIKQIDEDTNPVAIKTPWVYKDNISDIISSRTGLNGFEFNTIDNDKSVYKKHKNGGILNFYKWDFQELFKPRVTNHLKPQGYPGAVELQKMLNEVLVANPNHRYTIDLLNMKKSKRVWEALTGQYEVGGKLTNNDYIEK